MISLAPYIQRIEARGLHGRFDLEVSFQPDINVIYGRNGSGKTTLLHILANILNGSFDRFAYLQFSDIRVCTSENQTIEVCRTKHGGGEIVVSLDQRELWREQVESIHESDAGVPDLETVKVRLLSEEGLVESLPIQRASYFPAFRTMIEAWGDEARTRRPDEYRMSSRVGRNSLLTTFARELFGAFVPTLNYPSLLQIQNVVPERVREAQYAVATKGQEMLSEAFLDVISILPGPDGGHHSEDSILHLEEIGRLLEQLSQPIGVPISGTARVYDQLRQKIANLKGKELPDTAARILAVYRRSLDEQVKVRFQAYQAIERYVQSVNEFLEGKKMIISHPGDQGRGRPRVSLEFPGESMAALKALSSGERQIVCMLYAASYLSQGGRVVLIDEPELSLHSDWQRPLLRKMAQQIGNRQIIVCTHAPEIGADYEERYQELRPKALKVPSTLDPRTSDEDEEVTPI